MNTTAQLRREAEQTVNHVLQQCEQLVQHHAVTNENTPIKSALPQLNKPPATTTASTPQSTPNTSQPTKPSTHRPHRPTAKRQLQRSFERRQTPPRQLAAPQRPTLQPQDPQPSTVTSLATGLGSFERRASVVSQVRDSVMSDDPIPTPSLPTSDVSIPTPSLDSTPTGSFDQTPATPLDQTPTTPLDQTPATPLDQTPTTPLDQTPTSPLDQTPTTPPNHTPTTSAEQKLTASICSSSPDPTTQTTPSLHLLPLSLPSWDEVRRNRSSYYGPTEESNWVIPGRLMVGAYPSSNNDIINTSIIESILDEGITTFVCLQDEYVHNGVTEDMWRNRGFLRPYIYDTHSICTNRMTLDAVGDQRPKWAHPDELAFVHVPIVDCACTSDTIVHDLCVELCWRLINGENVYVHCWGGHGRSGTVIAVMLGFLYGLSVEESLKRTQIYHDIRYAKLNVRSPQTDAQCAQVRRVLENHVANGGSKLLISDRLSVPSLLIDDSRFARPIAPKLRRDVEESPTSDKPAATQQMDTAVKQGNGNQVTAPIRRQSLNQLKSVNTMKQNAPRGASETSKVATKVPSSKPGALHRARRLVQRKKNTTLLRKRNHEEDAVRASPPPSKFSEIGPNKARRPVKPPPESRSHAKSRPPSKHKGRSLHLRVR